MTGRDTIAWAEIVGLGDDDGLWRISTSEGDAAAGYVWCPWLATMPDILSVRVPWLDGGAQESGGSVTLEIADIGGAMTDILRMDAPGVAITDAATSAAASVINVAALPSVLAGSILWLGSEAVLYTGNVASPPTLQVTRAQLGTAAVAHASGSVIYSRPWWLQGRELTLYIRSDGTTRVVGVYTIDSVSLDSTGSVYTLQATAREPYLARRVPRRPVDLEVVAASAREDGIAWSGPAGLTRTGLTSGRVAIASTQSDEALLVLGQRDRYYLPTDGSGRRHARTPEDELPRVGNRYRRIMSVAAGDFRAAPVGAATTSRTSGSWTFVSSWPEVLLCILCSPAIETQAADNYNSAGTDWSGRNFSGLRAGYGCGVPYTEIDFDSFEVAAGSAAAFDLPNFLLGPEPMPFSEVAAPILRAAGAYLVREAGLLRVVVPELPLEGDAPSLTIDDVLLSGEDLPAVEVRRTEATTVSEVVYSVGHQPVPITVSWADRPRLFDPLDLYVLDGKPLTLDLPGGDPLDRDRWISLALRRLRRGYRPLTELLADLAPTSGVLDWALGQQATVQLPGIPNWQGARGIDAIGQLVEAEQVLDIERGHYVRARLILQQAARLGRISPSGYVTAVSTANATVSANRYTQTDAPTGLPATDAAGFTVGDVVQLVSAAGASLAGGATETVDGITGNVLELSGDFSSALAVGTVLVYAGAADLTARQALRYAAQGTSPLWDWA